MWILEGKTGLRKVRMEGRSKGNSHPTPNSVTMMDFPTEGRLYPGFLENGKVTSGEGQKIESIIGLLRLLT